MNAHPATRVRPRVSIIASGGDKPTEDRVSMALEEFAAAMEAGQPISKESLLAKYADVAEELAGCLDSLDFIRQVAPQLADAAPGNGAAAPIRPLATLGDFRIVRELGRGGMGVVYEAEQLSLGRRVALKVLPFAAMLGDQQLKRFHNEARAAATLDHPNIVAIFSVGTERGVHYFAMQLVEGHNLAQVIAELWGRSGGAEQTSSGVERKNSRPDEQKHSSDSTAALPSTALPLSRSAALPSDTSPIAALSTLHVPCSSLPAADSREFVRSVARLGFQAAEALDYAHQQGIIHRDVKPANLLVDAAGKLWVTDFGLARIEADGGITMTGDLVGTLRYMSPEQALAKHVVVDQRTDVYSLGVTLYELLTGRPAFGANDRSELLKQIAFDEPRPLRQVNRHVPRDLETIVLKAMEKDASDRYATAQKLADDLRALLEHRPIQVKPLSVARRAARWSRRHQGAVWIVVSVLLISTAVLTVANLYVAKWYREAQAQGKLALVQADEARKQEKTATAVSNFLQRMLYSANPAARPGNSYEKRELLDGFSAALKEQFAEQPEVEATLRATVGKAYWQLGLYSLAEPHLTSALALRRKALGAHHVKVGEVLLDYAWCLRDTGKLAEAIASAEEALAIFRQNGSRRDVMLTALTDLHRFLVFARRFEEADATADEALEIAGDLDTADMPVVARLMHGIAYAKLEQGEYEEAESIARVAVRLHRRLSGDQGIQTAWGLSNLGRALLAQRKYAEAEAVQRESLAIFRKWYPAEHRSIQLSICRLVPALVATGNRSEVVSLMEEAKNAYENATIMRSGDVNAFQNLAWLLATCPFDEARDGERAVEFARQACTLSSYQESRHVDTLAAAYAEVGDFDSAVEFEQKAIELLDKNSQDREDYTRRLESYQEGRPWREGGDE